jgi:hypothetical protein
LNSHLASFSITVGLSKGTSWMNKKNTGVQEFRSSGVQENPAELL